MALAVIICTYQRAHLLRRVLEPLLKQTAAPAEVVVVDNEGSAEVATVVESLSRAAPFPLRAVHEPQLGLSHARNRGLAETQAALVAFLDDDAFAAPGWVEALERGAAAHPKGGVFAGAVEPVAEVPIPPGFLESLGPHLAWLGALELGPQDQLLVNQGTAYAGPVGANMLFRREVFARAGRFDPTLGRVGTSLISGEEVALVNAAREHGWEVWYLGGARVQHLVHPQRLTASWFLERAYAEGVSIARALKSQGHAAAQGPALEAQANQVAEVLEKVGLAVAQLPLKTRLELMKIAGRVFEGGGAGPGLTRLQQQRAALEAAGLPTKQ